MRFSIVSWNVWFDRFERNARYSEILKISSQNLPDIICFQEVTRSFMKVLDEFMQLNPSIGEIYHISDDISGKTVKPYGVLTLAKKTFKPSFQFFPFPTHMSRQLLLTTLTLPNNIQIAVGNVHLESLNSAPLREKQLQISHTQLLHYPNYILCGDFNFCSYENFGCTNTPLDELENNCLYRVFPTGIDMWPYLHHPNNKNNTEMKGYTFHGRENDLIKNKQELMRYDRIMYGNNQRKEMILEPKSIELLGTDPISLDKNDTTTPSTGDMVSDPYSTPPSSSHQKILRGVLENGDIARVFPSDHYGLYGCFTIDTTIAQNKKEAQDSAGCNLL